MASVDDAASAEARELNDLRLVFANIAGYNQFVGLGSILKLPEVKAQLAEGDLGLEDLESAWLEACAVKGVSSVDPKDTDGAKYHVHQRTSWGVCTELSFEGFVHFLRLCEARAPLPPDFPHASEASPKDAKTGRDLIAARHRMIGLLRATLTVHQRGGGGEEEEKEHPKDLNAPLGETLHSSMVRAAVEKGLAHHTPETLHELMRTGVYKESELDVQLDKQEKKASLRLGLLSRKFSRDELVRAGILQDKTPGQLAGERANTAGRVLRHLQHHSAGSAADLLAAESKEQHHRRPSLDELKAQGIYRTPEQIEAEAKQHKVAAAFLQQELEHRATLSDLKDKGIYFSKEVEAQHRLERSMMADALNKLLRHRPYREDLMDRGLLEASELKMAFLRLEDEKGVSITTVQDLLKWTIIDSAIKERVVGLPALEEAFQEAMKIPSSDGGNVSSRQHMGYEQFDKFLSSAKTTQVEEEPMSLKLWALMRMRPDMEEQEHHDGNRRRNALIAQDLEQELGKREPLERLANKGIYLERTPAETAVERAHLVHMLKHGLARRSDLADLLHKGVYLEGVQPNDLEQAHRDARNFLEGTLSRRPALSTLLDKGYLEADELEEAFTELVVQYKHKDGTTTTTTTIPASADENCTNSNSRLLLPASHLGAWAPVQTMLRSGAAMDEDVAVATTKAVKASFHNHHQQHHHHQRDGVPANDDAHAGEGGMVDFVGFLEFIHSLDMEVDGLESGLEKADVLDDNDPEATARHARRLQMRRERASHAAEEDSYGTLKEHLMAHLRARPGKHDPETQRIAKEFHSTQAVDLEKNLIKNHLEDHLRSRAESAAGSLRSSGGGMDRLPSGEERTARIKELELAINKRMLKHRLTSGRGSTTSAKMEEKMEVVGGNLDRRASLEEITNQGIFQGMTPLQHSLERHLIEKRLDRSLRNPARPSKKDLIDHGIYIDATPRELQMEHYLAARNLKHGLEERESIQELKDHGIYQPETSVHAAHEKLLVKALLQRKLSHAFSNEELGRLKQKGVYKEAEHEKLEAERLLVTRQLAGLISKRPGPEQLEQQHPGLLEAGTLALVFEERVMPRAASGSAAAGTGDKPGVVCGTGGVSCVEADAENEGGPEHLVSFEALMSWPDVQEHLVGEGGEDIKHEMARHFDLCDSDGDGYLTFSQFLRWVELCDLNPEDHLQVTDAKLDDEYVRLAGAGGRGVTFDQALSYSVVRRWATSASLDRDSLGALWAEDGESSPEDAVKQAEGFKAFCRHCQSRSSAAHQMRLKNLQTTASSDEAKAKANLKAKLAAKLSARPDLEELRKSRIYRAGGLDPAMIHLERNLISISLKEQLLARPAVEDLEKRGIKPRDGTKARLEDTISKLNQTLMDSTMQHDDAQWRSHPSVLGAGPREEVAAFLQKSLSKRLSFDQLTNKGVYVVDTDASYALLVHQVLRAHRGFTLSSAQLIAGL
eukprot:g10735.t1